MFQSGVQQAITLAQNQMRAGNLPQTNDMNQMINALHSGDSNSGEQMANTIIQKLGISKEQAIQQAQIGLRKRGINF